MTPYLRQRLGGRPAAGPQARAPAPCRGARAWLAALQAPCAPRAGWQAAVAAARLRHVKAASAAARHGASGGLAASGRRALARAGYRVGHRPEASTPGARRRRSWRAAA